MRYVSTSTKPLYHYPCPVLHGFVFHNLVLYWPCITHNDVKQHCSYKYQMFAKRVWWQWCHHVRLVGSGALSNARPRESRKNIKKIDVISRARPYKSIWKTFAMMQFCWAVCTIGPSCPSMSYVKEIASRQVASH